MLPLVLIAGISGLFLLWRKAPSPSPTPTLPPVVVVEPSEPPPPMALPDPPKPSVVSVTNEPAPSPTPLPDVVVPPTSFFTIGSLRYKPQDLLSEGNLDLIAPTLLNGSVERASGSEGEFYFCLPTANSILPPLAMAAMSKWIEVNGGGAAVQGRLEALDRQASENERIALKDCLRQWTMLAPTVQSTTDRSHAFERHVRLMQEYYRYAQRSHPQELWAHLYSFHDKFQHSSLLLLTWDVLKQCQDRPEMARHALQYLESLVDSKSRQSTAITDDQRQFRRILTGKRTAATAAGVTVFSIQETSPTGVVKNLWSVTTRPPSRGGEWDAWLSVAGELPKPKLSGTLGATVELDLASCRTYNRTGEIRRSPDGHAAH